MLLRRNLPELLEANAVFLRLAILIEAKKLEQSLSQVAPRAFGEERVCRLQLDAACEGILPAAILANSHIAGGNASNHALRGIQHFAGGETRKDLDAQRFRLGGEPAAHVPKRHDEVAVVAHQR